MVKFTSSSKEAIHKEVLAQLNILEHQVTDTRDQCGSSASGLMGPQVSCVVARHACMSVERVILCDTFVCVMSA